MRHNHRPSNVEVIKPSLDKLEYRAIKLDNGLNAVLVSDVDADKAAAALDVSNAQFRPKIDLFRCR